MNSERQDNPYSIDRWSLNYFKVDEDGKLLVCLPGKEPVSFSEISKRATSAGLRLPVLLRFGEILHDRVRQLAFTFKQEIESQNYQAGYQVVYPIKVNQQRRVIEEIVASGSDGSIKVGLEAGSKPELLAVLAMNLAPGATIICNGYKDRDYIRTALQGQLLGYDACIVIEKASELETILEEAKSLTIKPRIGVRARLNSIGKGNWQNTGGEKSKFGLSSNQILDVIRFLKEENQLDCLSLLHFHLGSQIANIRDIQRGIQECTVIYAQLRKMGVAIDMVDIGGGLGIDYDGTESRNSCSINYRVEDYARTVVSAFKECCMHNGLPEPALVSESGRAISAHHAVLLTNVIDRESKDFSDVLAPSLKLPDNKHLALEHLHSDYLALESVALKRSPIEIYHDAKHSLDDIQSEFLHGHLDLEHKAQAEALYHAICSRLLDVLDPQHRDHLELIDELNEKLADKLFVNFSLFQSTPDIWGINQIFPILPIENLNSKLNRKAVIQDITCDSDGRVDQYVSNKGLQNYLALPEPSPGKQDLLCFFLVGAYQEILGDMHNLFGDTDSVDVSVEKSGEITLTHEIRGDTVADVLEYVNLSPSRLLSNYRRLLEAREVATDKQDILLREFEAKLGSYTYLNSET